ncbi:hypothetical protein T492DRAFT_972282 [Pavlovales sp. CCMP2436]|nr:hypothetical protein T492DRAFT_972282 [Pavlovales sp. CCMP2436]|mmetsp:Transcript_32890/g.81755  ORF Transcript_32890/g.81755 Transcript_32890/m.81755 type:complete len:198 (-) Transcript_32890:255-848(-)
MQAFLISALALQQVIVPTIPPVNPPDQELTRNLATSSLLSRVFGTHHTLLDTPFSLLPRLFEEDFTRSLNLLNRAVGGLVHVEIDDTKALKITFDDIGLYSKIDVKYDKESSVLTVMAEDGEGENKCEATRAITMPCHVIKPELIKAEVLDSKVVVTVPAEAQAEKKVQNKLKNQELDVRIVSGEETQRLNQYQHAD